VSENFIKSVTLLSKNVTLFVTLLAIFQKKCNTFSLQNGQFWGFLGQKSAISAKMLQMLHFFSYFFLKNFYIENNKK